MKAFVLLDAVTERRGRGELCKVADAFPVCLFVMLTQDIESRSICTANTPLIHWIRSNHKPDRQAPHVLGRKCVSQVRSEFQLKP